MWQSTRALFKSATHDLRGEWRTFAVTDIAYKAVAFAVLVPVTTWLLYLLRAATSNRVVADVDIALFFLTTPTGITTLILGSSLFIAITAIEAACLMAIGLSSARGATINVRGALRFGATQAVNVLRLAGNMVWRIMLGLIPFLLACGLVYFLLLHEHDINYYLSRHPLQFWIAAALVVVIAIALLYALARIIGRWALAMPLMLFENVSPRLALGESAKRTAGSHALILTVLAAWAVISIATLTSFTWLVDFVGTSIAPHFAGSIVPLLTLFAGLTLVGLLFTLAAGIFNFSLFALLITQLYLHLGGVQATTATVSITAASTMQFSTRGRIWIAAIAVCAVFGIGLFTFLTNRGEHAALVIAHRGSSAIAPENTLAAFNLAAEQHTDFVELDVQETSDGQVIVVHDSDLMKVGGNAAKIWNADAATLRSIDIGSFKDPRFASERVPTLAEALAACKGRCRVIVELKSYGHNQHLEERVAAIVEEAGMVNDCVFMSLDHEMVRKMKALRPNWRVGLLVAKAMGDLTELHADFLAVEARMASRRFVQHAHDAGQDVFIWTVNDPAWMFLGLTRGVDGLITDKPDVARKVIELRAEMSDPQRILLALLIRMGASTEALEAENALRP
jgi:glycerophosphoryl diester phosphodiesterase